MSRAAPSPEQDDRDRHAARRRPRDRPDDIRATRTGSDARPASSEDSDDASSLLWFGGGIAAGAAVTGTGVLFRKRTPG